MIREANSSDKEQINELYKMLVPNSKKRNVLGEQIDKIKEDPNNFLLVYEGTGAIIGTLTLNVCLQALHGESPYAVVENIIVHEDYQNQSIGKKLLEYVDQYCHSIDCHRVMLLSNSKRDKAHKFFEKVGFNGEVSKGFKKYINKFIASNLLMYLDGDSKIFEIYIAIRKHQSIIALVLLLCG